jgi:LeuA-like protein with dimerisation domain
VLKVITPKELARNLDPILAALEESGSTVIIKKEDLPTALLLRFDAYMAMLATMDYSGWERWVDEVRSAFPRATLSPPRRPKSLVPSFIDPVDLGYDPKSGQVGTEGGRRRLADELTEMGITLDEAGLSAAYSLVLNLAERKRVLYPEDIRLAADEAQGRTTPGRYALDEIDTHLQSGLPCTASVTIMVDGTRKSARASGAGPLDACFKAVQEITGVSPELEDFSLAAATRGSDALGEAVVTLSYGTQVVVGRAVSVDVVEAGVRAYLNALNWLTPTPAGTGTAASAGESSRSSG